MTGNLEGFGSVRVLNRFDLGFNLVDSFSSAEVSFVCPVGWGMGRGAIKRAGAGQKGNTLVPRAPPIFLILQFSISFPYIFWPFLH